MQYCSALSSSTSTGVAVASWVEEEERGALTVCVEEEGFGQRHNMLSVKSAEVDLYLMDKLHLPDICAFTRYPLPLAAD